MSARRGMMLLVGAALAAGAAVGAWHLWPKGPARLPEPAGAPAVGGARLDVPEAERAPTGVRIRVQVLNATQVRGLARRATFVLRDRGFDVVEVGNAGERRDSTLVIHLAGDTAWAGRVARALGGARVESRPDTSRYLDVSVLLGATWRPPAEPFYP